MKVLSVGTPTFLPQQKVMEVVIDTAQQVLPLFERQFPGDKRPQEAIRAAKNFSEHPSLVAAKRAEEASLNAWKAAQEADAKVRSMSDANQSTQIEASARAAKASAYAAHVPYELIRESGDPSVHSGTRASVDETSRQAVMAANLVSNPNVEQRIRSLIAQIWESQTALPMWIVVRNLDRQRNLWRS